MCEQARNMEKFGVPNPDRKQRHAVCKKQYDNDDDDDNNNSSYDENIDGNVHIKCIVFISKIKMTVIFI